MAPSCGAQSPRLSSFYLALPHLPFLRRPPLHNSLPGKGNRNQEGGVSEGKGGAVLHPLTQPKPLGAWGLGEALVPSPLPPRNPHSRRGTPQIRNTLLLLLPRSSRGQSHLYNGAVNIDILSCITPWEITPIWGAATPKPSQLGTGMRVLGGRGGSLKPGRPSTPTPARSGPLLGVGGPASRCAGPAARPSLRGLHGTFGLRRPGRPLLLLVIRGPQGGDRGARRG